MKVNICYLSQGRLKKKFKFSQVIIRLTLDCHDPYIQKFIVAEEERKKVRFPRKERGMPASPSLF